MDSEKDSEKDPVEFDTKRSAHFMGFLWLIVASLLAASLALGLPWFAHHVPWSWELRMASALGNIAPGESCTGSAASQKAFQKLLARIYPIYPVDHGFPINVTLVRGNEVNAFATLGGKIFVYSALLDQTKSAEELAGILAHEIEHVHHRHIVQGVMMKLVVLEGLSALFTGGPSDMSPQIAGVFLNLKFSKSQEAEADEDGFKRLHDGQVDVHGLAAFFARMDDGGTLSALLSDHPAGQNRARTAELYSKASSLPVLTTAEWQDMRRICKLGSVNK